jgi:hypothetical protein
MSLHYWKIFLSTKTKSNAISRTIWGKFYWLLCVNDFFHFIFYFSDFERKEISSKILNETWVWRKKNSKKVIKIWFWRSFPLSKLKLILSNRKYTSPNKTIRFLSLSSVTLKIELVIHINCSAIATSMCRCKKCLHRTIENTTTRIEKAPLCHCRWWIPKNFYQTQSSVFTLFLVCFFSSLVECRLCLWL